MDTIQVNVTAGQQGEYYNLIQVKQLIDQIQAEIGGQGAGNVVIEPSSVTELTVSPDHIYAWAAAPAFLNVTLEAPEDTTKQHSYTFIFEADTNFQLSIFTEDLNPVTINNDAAIITADYNKVCVNYINGVYHVNITNYRI